MFGGRDIVGYSQFRVTRDADLWFDEEEVKNLRQALEGELPQRHFGQAVRLEVAAGCPPKLAQFLLRQVDLSDDELYRVDGPVNLARMAALIDAVSVTGLEFPPFVPGLPDRLRDSADLLRRSGSTTCCCTIRSSRSIPSSSSSAVRRTTRTSSRSSRRSIAPASTRC